MDTLALAGTGDTFEVWVEQHLRAAYRLARAILLDDSEAEDAVQDACLVAWRHRSSLRDPARFGAWFDTILINGCRDRIRRRGRQRTFAARFQEENRIASTLAPIRDDGDLEAALRELDLEHRLVIVLRFWQDLSLEELAERLSIPTGTVKSRLHYSLKTLRRRMEAGHE